ncbi:MAG TPA: class II glutamine amidotransferase [Bacteroidales bacterium]|nr:class II glutamine amidotransferase [Bacteroidales bacterium]HPS73508.1 class II glutamine amidotransferase [Bacteroidales bacterium]
MSDFIHHECGIALVRLLKPLEYYLSKYGTPFYGLNKMHLLMEKQHNRGQDGGGIAALKLGLDPGKRYISRIRSNSDAPIKEIFSKIGSQLKKIEAESPQHLSDTGWLKNNVDIYGELFLGHLRYGTFGKNTLDNIHPFIRENNWITRNLVLAGNFNLTNVDELFDRLIDLGQYPVETSDSITILEKICHYLDEENDILFRKFRKQGIPSRHIPVEIAKSLDVQKILTRATDAWDGGYVIAGFFGHGDSFVMRDPAGIRPAFYYADDEIVAVASERPVIQTTLNLNAEQIREIKPGHALIIKLDGTVAEKQFSKPVEKRSCSFERIYFSRGTDKDIYVERKNLGKFLTPSILKAVNYDMENTVFSFIPNTAVDAFYGMIEELNNFCSRIKKEKILGLDKLSPENLDRILQLKPRMEKVAVKDMKLRTFITKESHRDDLVTHVYDITYGTIRKGMDNLVVIDDSIVRGTTLKQSIIRILDRLGPKKIVVASSAPQIRYPDCYGIDMAKMNDFIAFKAAIALLRETRQEHIINDVYNRCKAQENIPKEEVVNYVKGIYTPFTADRISEKVSELVTPPGNKSTVEIVYQSIENLHAACPGHTGDWYFTGDYPTPGGNKVVNRAFINFIEGRDIRAY